MLHPRDAGTREWVLEAHYRRRAVVRAETYEQAVAALLRGDVEESTFTEPQALKVMAVREPQCQRHGGTWGEDETCDHCIYDSGRVRPLDDPGPLGP